MIKKSRRIQFRGQSRYMVGVKVLMAAVGTLAYIYTEGTLMFGIFAFFLFGLMVELATAGYHRWITHNALEPTIVGKYLLWFCMISVGSLRPSAYAIIHRMHHKFGDTEKDPHPPSLGFFNCLIGNYDSKKVTFSVPVLDLYRKKDIVFVDKYFWYLYALTFLTFLVINPHLAMLSFPFLILRYHVQSAAFNYIAHGGKKVMSPQNLKFFPAIIFWSEHLHLNHHLNQNKANYGKISTFNFDYMYMFLSKTHIIRN